jgi:threonine/homoserine/homoserine lactone efflux protein
MGQAIGNILPLALGVALSPIPIIAVILMLLSPRALENGLAFLVGWVVGLAAVSIVVIALFGSAGLGSGSGSALGSLIKTLLGLLLVGLAVRNIRKRPSPGKEPELPGWMRAIDSLTAVKTFGIAVLLTAINPKNLSLTVAAAVTVAQAGLSTASVIFVMVLFVILSSLGIAVPVALYILGGSSATRVLNGLRTWLNANNSTVTAVLLLVIGVVLFGKGLGGLIS